MHDVFVSYATPDRQVAEAIVHHLESIGIRCFYAPRNMRSGVPWPGQLVEGIKAAKLMVLVLSEKSNGSEPVRQEIFLAVKAGLKLIPFKLEAVDLHPDLEFHLEGQHWLDAINPPLAARIQELGVDLCLLLKRDPAPVFEAPEIEPEPEVVPPPPPRRTTPQRRPNWKRWALIGGACLAALALWPKAPRVLGKQVVERVTTQGNSLDMKFVPFTETPNNKVLGCIHETRSKDFAAFIADKNRGYEMKGEGTDLWRTYEFKPDDKSVGIPVGRGKDEKAEDSSHPVSSVTFEDAQAFCQWLTAKERSAGLIGPKDEYRLPLDAEWSLMVGLPEEKGSTPEEKSKNGQSSAVYPWGSWPDTKKPPTGKIGNYADETAKAAGAILPDKCIKGYTDDFATTAPVMSFTRNSKGFFDLGGNAYEWCEDWCDADKKGRVLRGASWGTYEESLLLSSGRGNGGPGARYFAVGFRCVLVVVGG